MSATSAARELLADALDIPLEQIQPTARIGEVEQWDSLAHMRILFAIEERIGRPMDPEDAVAIESLDDIVRLLERLG